MFHVEQFIGFTYGIFRMGLLNLSRFCVAVFFISAVNLAQANYIYDPVTRTWLPTSTVLAPPNSGSVFTSTSGIPPNPTPNNGGFTTTHGGSFGSAPANGTSKRVPVTIQGHATKVNVNTAVATRLARGGLYGIALGYGIETLMNGVGWLINEGGTIQRIEKTPPTENLGIWKSGSNVTGNSAHEVFDKVVSNYPPLLQDSTLECSSENTCRVVNPRCGSSGTCEPISRDLSKECPPPYVYADRACAIITNIPVPPQDIADTVDNSYNPHASDYPTIVSEPSMQPTETTIEPIPRLNFPSVQTTYTDLDTGQTTVTDTNIWHDYIIHNNGSSQPKIESQETEQTDTYQDGTKTSTSTKTASSGVATGTEPAPSPSPDLELPPFCAWAGIVCDWIGWTQEPIEDDLDLSALITDDDYERSYTINFGSNVCPPPISINIIFLNKTVELSYEPACVLATYAKPFVLISAYIFAIMITLGVVRNG